MLSIIKFQVSIVIVAFLSTGIFECIGQKGQNEEDTTQTTKILVEITNLGKLINTVQPEYAPVISADESMMLFTRKLPPLKSSKLKGREKRIDFENVYMTKRRRTKWNTPRKLPTPINQVGRHISAIALSNDGQRMLLFKEEQIEKKGDYQGDIYESKLKGRRWLEPVKLLAPINSPSHESSASYSYDGKTIFFVSEREGGLGGRDIYKATIGQDDKWGEAINLGPAINTPEDEEGIFAHPDGKTIYFSSKGHNSIGGYDIFKSVLQEDGEWSKPENLRAINTPGNDNYFVMSASGEHGYYSAVRKDGQGEQDIYLVTFTEIKEEKKAKPKSYVTILKGIVTDENTNLPLEADIEVIDNEKNESIAVFNSNSETGEYLVSLPQGKNYGIVVKAKGYLFHSENIYVPLFEEDKLYLINEKGEILMTGTKSNEKYFRFTKLPPDENYLFYCDAKDAGTTGELQIQYLNENNEEVNITANKAAGNLFNFGELPYSASTLADLDSLIDEKIQAGTQKTASSGYQEIIKNIALKKIKTGAKIVLNNIFFDFDRSSLRPESTAELERLTELLNDIITMKIEISGHTDNKGSDEYNQNLSESRAKSVVDYLIEKGIDKNHLVYKGYGESRPIADNDTEKGRQTNRRTEFEVLEN